MNSRAFWLLLILLIFGLLTVSSMPHILFLGNQDPYELVLIDAKSKYPGATIELYESSQIGNDKVYRFFVLRKQDSVCPERLLITYTYPRNRFNVDVEDITSGCKICKTEKCIIAYPEEAVIASYQFDQKVRRFIDEHPDAKWQVKRKSDGFVVIWQSQSGSSIQVFVSSTAEVILLQ